MTARELADKFEVSVRTIQRDMEAIALAGIPIVTIQGPSGGSERQQELFRILEKAVENRQLVTFSYTNNRMEQTERTVEPMTLAFKWRSWYLFGFCRLRMDYRIFRLDRIRKPAVEDRRFRRREKNFEGFSRETGEWQKSDWVDLRLRFAPLFRPVIEEYYPAENTTVEPDGSLIVDMRMPEDGWVYGMILSYGKYVEVLAPERIRDIIRAYRQPGFRLFRQLFRTTQRP